MPFWKRTKSSEASISTPSPMQPGPLDNDMYEFVEQLRAQHGLDQEPEGMTRKERKEWHKARKEIGNAVVSDFERGLSSMIESERKGKH